MRVPTESCLNIKEVKKHTINIIIILGAFIILYPINGSYQEYAMALCNE